MAGYDPDHAGESTSAGAGALGLRQLTERGPSRGKGWVSDARPRDEVAALVQGNKEAFKNQRRVRLGWRAAVPVSRHGTEGSDRQS
jgi:hypothetical protein